MRKTFTAFMYLVLPLFAFALLVVGATVAASKVSANSGRGCTNYYWYPLPGKEYKIGSCVHQSSAKYVSSDMYVTLVYGSAPLVGCTVKSELFDINWNYIDGSSNDWAGCGTQYLFGGRTPNPVYSGQYRGQATFCIKGGVGCTPAINSPVLTIN